MFGYPNDLNSTLEVNGELKSANELVDSCPTIETVLLAKIEGETFNLKITPLASVQV